MKQFFLLCLLSCCFLMACGGDDDISKTDEQLAQLETDKDLIQEYLNNNGLIAEETEDGLFYIITREGTGRQPKSRDVVRVDYEGFLLDGTKFDSSYDRGTPAVFSLENVIEGWQKGIPLLTEGGAGTLLIPACLGYSIFPPPNSGIPQNAVLLFNVELIEVVL